jgi:hypothetical protein
MLIIIDIVRGFGILQIMKIVYILKMMIEDIHFIEYLINIKIIMNILNLYGKK